MDDEELDELEAELGEEPEPAVAVQEEADEPTEAELDAHEAEMARRQAAAEAAAVEPTPIRDMSDEDFAAFMQSEDRFGPDLEDEEVEYVSDQGELALMSDAEFSAHLARLEAQVDEYGRRVE